jgi:phage baseplate assembly protein W
MENIQKYGIKYPFMSDNNDGTYLDLNKTYSDSIKSQVLHIIFTPKGQKLRDPEFGTNLIKFLFNPIDNNTLEDIKSEITSQITKYVPSVEFRDLSIYSEEENNNSVIIIVEYSVNIGNKQEITKVAIKL